MSELTDESPETPVSDTNINNAFIRNCIPEEYRDNAYFFVFANEEGGVPYPIPREFTGPEDDAGNRPTYRLREAGYAVSTEAKVETTMIGPRTIIHAGAKIGEQCMIGSSCDIGGNVSLQNNSSIGDDVIVSDSKELVAVGMVGGMYIMEKVVINTSHESEG